MQTIRRFLALAATYLALTLAAAASVLAQPLGGSGIDPASAVAAVVQVPKPWYAPQSLVVSRMRDTIPQYAAVPGLAYKAFSLAQADGRYGGIYLWKDQSSARAFFNPAWFERIEKERGVQGQVQLYEVPVAIDNTNGAVTDADNGVATVVTMTTPPGVTKARMIQEFQTAIPLYRKVPGLLRKYFILTDDGRFGGIYLWQDEASAQQWFTAAWKERVQKTYGAQAALEWFYTPILLPSSIAGNQPNIPDL